MKLQPGLKPEVKKKLKCPDLESGDNGQHKKKNKKHELVSEENDVSPSDPEKVLRGSKKKKKEMETEEEVVRLTSETRTRSEGRKKKKEMETEEEVVRLTSETRTRSEGRQKKKRKEQMETEEEEVSLTSETRTRSEGRKKKEMETEEEVVSLTSETRTRSEGRSKKKEMETEEEVVSLTSETRTRSEGRQKKKRKEQMETEEEEKKKHEEQLETQEVETGTKLEGRKKKKKKTSSPPDDENSNVVMNGAETTPHGDKSEEPTQGKKKGKNKHVLEIENDQDTECGSSTTKVTKIKKKNKTDVLLSMDGETLDDDPVTAGETVTNEGSGKQKKKRRKQNCTTETQENPTNTARAAESGNVCNGLESKKVKKKRKKEIPSTEDDDGLPNAAGGDGLKTTKGKKKVIFQLEDTEDHLCNSEDPNGNEPSEISQNDLHPKKKKKKVPDTNLQMSTWDHSQEPVIEKSKPKKEKKKQEREEESQSLERDPAAKQEEVEAPKKKKRKQTGENTEELKAQKAQKIKLEEKSQDTESDVEIVSVREGNADEKQIDTVRRKALQEEIDRESGKSKRFGQWDTATFQNSEQQTKFLRLLGGFKKGNEATLKSPGQPKANMALSKAGEQTLERNLMQEFDKALGWKQNRGLGLGFQPQPKKSFYIDKTFSKSTKFED
ncbi:lysine-rich nucleolar protein 1 isoform 2-T2 [Discoglossus pictus]